MVEKHGKPYKIIQGRSALRKEAKRKVTMRVGGCPMFYAAICDDEEYFRFREKKLIEQYMESCGYACRIDLFASGKELLDKTETDLPYDAIFLDISMEEMDGLQTAERIRKRSETVCIVFVTAYITYALEGYKVGAARYLLKEEGSLESALKECLDTITERMKEEESVCEFEFQNGKKSIPTDAILYVESRLHKVTFFIKEDRVKEYSRYDRLDAVEKELRQYGFYRVHQSFLVNMKYVRGVERYKVSLANGTEVSISKKYYKDVEKEYIRRQGEI